MTSDRDDDDKPLAGFHKLAQMGILRAPGDGAREEAEAGRSLVRYVARPAGNVVPLSRAGGDPPKARRALDYVMAHDIEPELEEGGSLVAGLLDTGSMSVVYGNSNVGKTFWGLDLAMHVAMGTDWRGRHVGRGVVVYVVAEGGRGIRNRVAAWRQHHDIGSDQAIPCAIVASPVDLLDPNADTGPLIALIRAAGAEMGQPVVMVAVDTLSRALAGGDENSSKDMGAFVRNVDRIREETGAHLMVVHHAGKDTTKGARGHSLLRAATDTEIELIEVDRADKRAVAEVRKQRDLPGGETFAFRLVAVPVGQGAAGGEITSAIVEHTDAEGGEAENRKPVKLSATEETALKLLADTIAAHGQPMPDRDGFPTGNLVGQCVTEDTWRGECDTRRLCGSDKPNSRAQAFRRVYEALLRKGHVAAREGLVWRGIAPS